MYDDIWPWSNTAFPFLYLIVRSFAHIYILFISNGMGYAE
jgi:hypothetical protein